MKINSQFRIPPVNPGGKDTAETQLPETFAAGNPPTETVKKLAKIIGWDKVKRLAEPTPLESTAHLTRKERL